jgi:hypothetical protein
MKKEELYEVIEKGNEEEQQRAFEGLMILNYPWMAEVEDQD